jgi:glycosyltransferase involved in cell wall biosynthesis
MISVVLPVYLTKEEKQQEVSRVIAFWSKLVEFFPTSLEVVVVDDASTVDFYKPKNLVHHRIHQNVRWNQPVAKNIGAKLAVGDYVIYITEQNVISDS